MDLYFCFLIWLYSDFFLFFCQGANKTGLNCAIKGSKFSKKHKLGLHKAKSREPNYLDPIF